MSYCFNPNCLYQNPDGSNFCQRCGSQLLLTERYRAVELIGQGGFGRTFKAIDQNRLNTTCVIKQFLPLPQGSQALQKATEMFQQEAVLLRDLGKHAQIPDLLAFFEEEGRLYLIQEFVDGQDLRKELILRGIFSEEQVRQVLKSLLPVLQFVHEQDVIHRDIKPENIVRSPNGSLVLIDFGVSKQLSGNVLTKIGTVTGTPGYAAPEQMRGIVCYSSDLYALGVTCIRLLTGCLPQDDGSDELFDAVNMRWKWREQGVLVEERFGRIIDKLLEEKPRNRYQSANEVLQELELTVVSLPTTSQTVSVSVPQPPPRKQRGVGGGFWWQWLLANGVGLTLGFSIGGAMWNVFSNLTVTGTMAGTLLGFPQWLVFRKQIPRASWLILSTIVGVTVGFVVGGSVDGVLDSVYIFAFAFVCVLGIFVGYALRAAWLILATTDFVVGFSMSLYAHSFWLDSSISIFKIAFILGLFMMRYLNIIPTIYLLAISNKLSSNN